MSCNGKSIDKVATALKQSKKVALKFIQAPEKYGEAEQSRRSRRLSAADRNILLFEADGKQKSTGQFCQGLDLPTGTEIVRQMMCNKSKMQ